MPIFDIRRSNSVTELWKGYVRRTASMLPPAVPKEEKPAEEQETSSINNPQGQETESAYTRWVKACNPPQLLKTTAQSGQNGIETGGPTDSEKPQGITRCPSFLTELGRKQVSLISVLLVLNDIDRHRPKLPGIGYVWQRTYCQGVAGPLHMRCPRRIHGQVSRYHRKRLGVSRNLAMEMAIK